MLEAYVREKVRMNEAVAQPLLREGKRTARSSEGRNGRGWGIRRLPDTWRSGRKDGSRTTMQTGGADSLGTCSQAIAERILRTREGTSGETEETGGAQAKRSITSHRITFMLGGTASRKREKDGAWVPQTRWMLNRHCSQRVGLQFICRRNGAECMRAA